MRIVKRYLLVPVLLAATFPSLRMSAQEGGQHPLAGADESTPSRSHYFSWINNTNEGSTEAQTLANLDFFKWLHDEYGMELDIYAFDAGTIDAPRYYGSIYSDRFKEHYPNGLDPIYEKARSFGCRLGVWLGPDGFGDTPEEEKARTAMLVKLCRDYNFHLFKVDAVCGQLRTEKQDAFVRMLKECRKYSPDLIVLNHRLNLGHGVPHVTTRLCGGEAYIDVWRSNRTAATHNRACTVAMGIPVDRDSGKLQRLVEDLVRCAPLRHPAAVRSASKVARPSRKRSRWNRKDPVAVSSFVSTTRSEIDASVRSVIWSSPASMCCPIFSSMPAAW